MNKTYYATADIENYQDILCFAEALQKIPEFQKLTSEEKQKIIFSYPVKIVCVSKSVEGIKI